MEESIKDTSKEASSPIEETQQNAQNIGGEPSETGDNETKLPESGATQITQLEEQLAEMNDKYLRLFSDFDNYRKRTARERVELVKTAGEDFFKAVLPVIDDFERGLKAMNENQNDISSLKEGVELIFNKFINILTARGLQPIVCEGQHFNDDLHEAVTSIPAPQDDLKGKVVDVLEKGYLLNEKVIRYAKVVVGL